MPTSIELRFDAISEAKLRELWSRASTHHGTEYMLRHGVVPHVALLVSDDSLGGVFPHIPPTTMAMALQGIGFFSGGEVAYLQIAEDSALREYQRVCFGLAREASVRIHEYYSPDRWLPHCTIAQACTRNLAVPIAFSRLDVQVRSLIYVEYPPTRVVAER